MRHVVTTLGVGVALLAAAACTSTAPGPGGGPSGPSEQVVLGDARDRTASRTAEDWVTYADHVLVVTVVKEVRGSPSKDEIEKGEGLVPRTVQLRVDKVLWSAPDAPQPPPQEVSQQSAGWILRENRETKFALRDFARLEQGHTYVKALEWIDDPCDKDPSKGSWGALGAGDTIPFDTDALGAGEFEGRILSQQQAEATFGQSHGVGGLRAQLAGEPVTAVAQELNAAKPRTETSTASECDPSDQ